MSNDQFHLIATFYLPKEGGFASRLADAYIYADPTNKQKIQNTFYDLFNNAFIKWHKENEE